MSERQKFCSAFDAELRYGVWRRAFYAEEKIKIIGKILANSPHAERHRLLQVLMPLVNRIMFICCAQRVNIGRQHLH